MVRGANHKTARSVRGAGNYKSADASHKKQMPRGVLPRGALRKRGALVRDVIADALCGPNGYFATRLPVLASHTALPFREMKGRADYERALRERYAERAGQCINQIYARLLASTPSTRRQLDDPD